MNCPCCGMTIKKKEKNPNPGSDMHIFSYYESGDKESFDGPVDSYRCSRCTARFYMDTKNARKKRPKVYRSAKKEKYYAIWCRGYKIGKCTSKADVLAEEPDATFKEISKAEFEKEED